MRVSRNRSRMSLRLSVRRQSSLRHDQIRQFLPWLDRPVARCGTGWRGQHEHSREVLQRRLLAQRYRLGGSSVKKACGLLAGEGDRRGPVLPHLFPESRNVDWEGEGLTIHARARFAQIGEANSGFQQRPKLMRLVSARRDADLMDRAPKAIAGMRIVMAQVGRPLSGSGADEHQSQTILQLVGKSFQLVRAFFVRRNGNGGLCFVNPPDGLRAHRHHYLDRPLEKRSVVSISAACRSNLLSQTVRQTCPNFVSGRTDCLG